MKLGHNQLHPRLARLDITVSMGGSEIWRRTLNPDGGISRRNTEELQVVVAALESALIQARVELSSVEPNVVSNIGAAALTNVDCDVPAARMGSGDADGEVGVESAIVSIFPTSLETSEVNVVCKHDVTLGVAVNDDNVASVKMLSGVDEFHGDKDS